MAAAFFLRFNHECIRVINRSLHHALHVTVRIHKLKGPDAFEKTLYSIGLGLMGGSHHFVKQLFITESLLKFLESSQVYINGGAFNSQRAFHH